MHVSRIEKIVPQIHCLDGNIIHRLLNSYMSIICNLAVELEPIKPRLVAQIKPGLSLFRSFATDFEVFALG